MTEDEAAIRRLLADYCYYTDASDVDRLCTLFTEDFAFTGVFGECRGHEAMREMHRTRGPERIRAGRHLTLNSVVDLAGDEATGRSYIVVLAGGEQGAEALEQRFASIAPLRSACSAEDVADAIAWLLEGARRVTGERIYVDAGIHIASQR